MDEAQRDALLSALRSALVTIGGALATTGLLGHSTTADITMWAGVVVVIVGALWGVYDKFQVAANTKVKETIAVQAGVAAQAGLPAGPAPVITPAQAQTIIKTFVGTGDGHV